MLVLLAFMMFNGLIECKTEKYAAYATDLPANEVGMQRSLTKYLLIGLCKKMNLAV
jgi:hypothetical protein